MLTYLPLVHTKWAMIGETNDTNSIGLDSRVLVLVIVVKMLIGGLKESNKKNREWNCVL